MGPNQTVTLGPNQVDIAKPSKLSQHEVDLLFVGGGNTFRLLDIVRRSGFLEPVRRFWQTGGDYYGGSAGAVLACETTGIAAGHDSNEPGLQDLTALGMLPGAAILPHFTDQQLADGRKWAREHRVAVLGLPESVGLRCTGGTAPVVGVGQLTRIIGHAIKQVRPGESFDIATR